MRLVVLFHLVENLGDVPLKRKQDDIGMQLQIQSRPPAWRYRAHLLGAQWRRVGSVERIDQRAFQAREIRDERKVLAQRILAQKIGEVKSRLSNRKMRRWMLDEVAGHQIVKPIVADHRKGRVEILFEHGEN